MSAESSQNTPGKLAGRTALITGAGTGIGQAVAEAFAAESAAVVCADISLESAQAVAAGITASGGRSLAVRCDVSDPDQAKVAVEFTAAESTVAETGGLHILVCNAAVLTPLATVEELSLEDWQRALSVNLTGAFLMCKYALPFMRAGGGGSIILMASQMGRVAYAGQAAYCTTKGALLQLAKGMALDHCGDAIRVNTLSPGGIATNRLAQRFGSLESAQKEWGPMHPMGRLGEPEEIARGAVFLASGDSSFMTGADLLIDGGYTAW
jgi:NAD(P)-dependent dehydrogenase (short-subunit alcohol dehydrogenase family)